MTVYHGTILTVDPEDRVCRYLVEEGGRIAFVGDELPEAYRDAPVTELGDGSLIPPFADTHQHFASFSAFNAGLNVMEARSNREILEMVDRFARESRAGTLIAFGASPYSVEEGRLVSREELDPVTHGKPLFLVKYDGHACVVNTALLKKLPEKLKSLRGYHPESGEMNQEAFFAVSDFITNSISPLELLRDMQMAADFQAARGIGMIHTVSGVGFALNLDISMENADKLVPIFEPIFREKTSDEWLKIFADLDIVCGRLNHFRDVLTDEQAWANGYLQEYECTNGAKRVLPSCPVRLGSQGVFPLGKPVMYGTGNEEILKGLGYAEEEIAAMTEAGVFK